MSKAGHPVQALETFLILAGLPASQVPIVAAQIVADAESSLRDRQENHDEGDSRVEDTLNSNHVHCRYYKMLKAGLTPDQVFQLMTVVSHLPPESARSYLNSLVAKI